MRVLSLGWWYFFSKFVDLLDTAFFILRKKDKQVTALHVIHHSTLPFLSWWGPRSVEPGKRSLRRTQKRSTFTACPTAILWLLLRFVGGGQTGFGPFLNSGVHTVMYLYYLLAALGPAVQKHLWWKKYITTLQLVQFVMVDENLKTELSFGIPVYLSGFLPRPAADFLRLRLPGKSGDVRILSVILLPGGGQPHVRRHRAAVLHPLHRLLQESLQGCQPPQFTQPGLESSCES